MIKYILWDIDNTLLNFDHADSYAFEACFEKYGLGPVTPELSNQYKEINKWYWDQLAANKLSKIEVLEGRFKEFFSKNDFPLDIVPEFNIDYQKFLGHVAQFTDMAKGTVLSLKGKYIQCAATNGTLIAQKGKLKTSGLDNILDKFYISDLIGYEKPDKRFYDAIFEDLGDDDKNAYIMVGDSLISDMAGGINAGIKTVWYNPKKITNDKGLEIDYEIENIGQIHQILEENK